MDDELGWQYIERYLELRKAGKLGTLWLDRGQLALSAVCPADPDLGVARIVRSEAEDISLNDLRKRIDYWYPGYEFNAELPVRKPMHTASYGLHRFRQQSR